MSDKTIRLTVDLTYDPDAMHGDDEDGIEWFNGVLFGDYLELLDCCDIGDTIGSVKVVSQDTDSIEELEAKLQAVVEDKVDVVVELTKLKTHLEDFFALLEITEQKEDGRYFHPTTIQSRRALDAEKLETILAELKRSITANDKSDG